MPELTWYYPDNPKALRDLLKQPGVFPHGGGTALLKRDIARMTGLIDLSGLPYRDIQIDHKKIRLGAMSTYADVLDTLSLEDPDHLLIHALQSAASTPLRNRITIGGSVAAFPVWSDLMGPLLAMDTEISLFGSVNETVPIQEYVTNSELRKGTLVTTVSFPNRSHRGFYHRETRTVVDYPAFTVTILLDESEGTVTGMRVVLIGTTRKFAILDTVTDACIGKPVSDLAAVGVELPEDVTFPNRKHGSSDYLREMALLSLRQGLKFLSGGDA